MKGCFFIIACNIITQVDRPTKNVTHNELYLYFDKNQNKIIKNQYRCNLKVKCEV